MKDPKTSRPREDFLAPETVTSVASEPVRDSRAVNFVLKCLAVLGAFLIWLYAVSLNDPSFTREITGVPVEIIGSSSAGLSVMSGYDYTVDVTVQGKKSDINALTADSIEAYADLSPVTEAGRYALDVQITLPGGVSLVSRSVNTVSVYMDNRSTVSLPISVKLASYMLDDGYELGEITSNISEVKVEGPSSVLDHLSAAQARLELGHITAPLTVTQGLELLDDNGSVVTNPYVELKTTQVELTVPLYTTRQISLTVAYKYGYFNDATVSVDIEPKTITIKGEPKAVEALDALTLTTIDEKRLTATKLNIPIELPDGVRNVYGIENAIVTITHTGTETRELVIENFTVNNPNNVSYSILDDFLTVTLRGPSDKMAFISPSNVRAALDLSGYTNASGVTSVPVRFSFSALYQGSVYELGEYRVSVRISAEPENGEETTA